MTARKTSYRLIVAVSLGLLLGIPAAAQRLAVKTNVLSWAAGTPDLGVELVTGERTSLSFSVFGSYNPYWRDKSAGESSTSFLVLQPEFRFWFNGRPLTRFYAGVNALAAAYDFPLSGILHKGNAAGVGLTAGYVFNLTKRLDLALSAGAGAVYYWGKRQPWEIPLPKEDEMPQTCGYKLMPTQLGVTLVYIIR
jgi:hypothetical protein